jgi:hypothetical protein
VIATRRCSRLIRLPAFRRQDLKDRFRIGLADLLDFHSPATGRDHAHPFHLSIKDIRQIKLPHDIDSLIGFSFATGLSRDESFSEQSSRGFMDFVIGPAYFDPTSFAAPSGMNLRLSPPNASRPALLQRRLPDLG